MSEYLTELESARKSLADLKKAHTEHIGSRGLVQRYKINGREMEFATAADIVKLLKYWEREIVRLETAAGVKPPRPRRILTRF